MAEITLSPSSIGSYGDNGWRQMIQASFLGGLLLLDDLLPAARHAQGSGIWKQEATALAVGTRLESLGLISAKGFNRWGMTIRSTTILEFHHKDCVSIASLMHLMWPLLAGLPDLDVDNSCINLQCSILYSTVTTMYLYLEWIFDVNKHFYCFMYAVFFFFHFLMTWLALNNNDLQKT